MTENVSVRLSDNRRLFLFLVAYRWASLIPALWIVLSPGSSDSQLMALALMLAAANTLLITILHRPLNRLLAKYPFLLGVDLLFVAILLAISGGVSSPYYLYALSPLLAGAFFFSLKGALSTIAVFTPLYLLAILYPQQFLFLEEHANLIFTQIAGIWLIPILMAYPALLLKRLEFTGIALERAHTGLTQQNAELANANQQLKILHDLAVLLQSAPDIWTVQEQVLAVVTRELGFSRAAVGLVDQVTQELSQWRIDPAGETPPPDTRLRLDGLDDRLGQDLLDRTTPWYAHTEDLVSEAALVQWLGDQVWLCLPLHLRNHPVGVLLVASDARKMEDDRLEALNSVASQAALALGTTMVCIDRARRLAVEQERNRIARDIHDTVAQSLFGIVFSLDACITMLPDQADRVRQELEDLLGTAASTRDQVRHSIYDLWPTELDLERFQADLRSTMDRQTSPMPFAIDFLSSGSFERLSPSIRRTLYRVAQEALANVARHAGVNSAELCLDVQAGSVELSIRDQGKGFDTQMTLSRVHNRDRFGLHGIQERVQSLGGEAVIQSEIDQGTLIHVSIPIREAVEDAR